MAVPNQKTVPHVLTPNMNHSEGHIQQQMVGHPQTIAAQFATATDICLWLQQVHKDLVVLNQSIAQLAAVQKASNLT